MTISVAEFQAQIELIFFLKMNWFNEKFDNFCNAIMTRLEKSENLDL